jgi:transposase
MLYVGLDLSRKRLDWLAIDREGELAEVGAVPPDRDGLAKLGRRLGDASVLAVIESMSGARFLFQHGIPSPHRDLFGAGGRCLLTRLQLAEPWASTLRASLLLIDELAMRSVLQASGANPLALAASAIRTSQPANSSWSCTNSYTGLTPRVEQSGERDRRGPLRKNGPNYLRWALIEAAHTAGRNPHYQPIVERMRARHGRTRGSKIAAIEIGRRLTEAIWHMLTHDRPFAPAGAATPLAA